MNDSCSGELDIVSSILLAILHTISGLLSIGGNAIILIAIWQNSSLQTVPNYFIGSLAVADLSVGAIISPLWVTKSALNVWENTHFLTVFTEFMCTQTLVTTTYGLALISYDRYLAITSVYRYLQVMTLPRCIYSIIAVWIFSFGFAATRFAVQDPLMLPYLWLAVSVVCYTVPFSVIVYCYYYIFREARRQKRQIEAVETSIGIKKDSDSDTTKSIRHNRKAAYTIGIIIGLYLLFALPSMVIAAIQLITQDDCLKLKIIKSWFWGALISFASSACNPWVYAARSTEFRQAFKNIWMQLCVRNCKRCCCNN